MKNKQTCEGKLTRAVSVDCICHEIQYKYWGFIYIRGNPIFVDFVVTCEPRIQKFNEVQTFYWLVCRIWKTRNRISTKINESTVVTMYLTFRKVLTIVSLAYECAIAVTVGVVPLWFTATVVRYTIGAGSFWSIPTDPVCKRGFWLVKSPSEMSFVEIC